MIEGLPDWINLLFLLTVSITIMLFYLANGKSRGILVLLLLWSAVQSVIAFSGFYQTTEGFPPRFSIVLLPAALFVILGLLPKYRERLLKDRNKILSTFLHTVRIPVEIVLLYLFMHGMVPELMTFEGRNFDMLAGLTAPVVGALVLLNRVSNSLLICWNVICLCLVIFIMVNGILSSELPFQQFGFEQPNKAINFFPFVLLPAVVVPVVIYTHLTDLILLLQERKAAKTV